MAENTVQGKASGRWMLLAGAASVAALAASYLAYGYSKGWKGAAYSLWCPKRRLKEPQQSPFYAQVDQSSEKVDVDARTWMVRYVRTSLKGKVSGENNAKNVQETTPRTDNMREMATSEGKTQRRVHRSDSLVRGGTGRYAEELGDCIATEKGLLKRDDF
mmetsp:Transcript_1306/g.1963  ORF Transcript_1306/g.1963 Transcript_1306/m.1963 type:complete len:160 (+) Transcript_1306:38-517(+)